MKLLTTPHFYFTQLNTKTQNYTFKWITTRSFNYYDMQFPKIKKKIVKSLPNISNICERWATTSNYFISLCITLHSNLKFFLSSNNSRTSIETDKGPPADDIFNYENYTKTWKYMTEHYSSSLTTSVAYQNKLVRLWSQTYKLTAIHK